MNPKFKFKIASFGVFLFCILFTSCGSQSPLSREEAESLILSEVIGPDTITSRTVAYLTKVPLEAGDQIRTPVDEKALYTMEGKTWFAWLDDAPTALYEHPVRFVFVDVNSGKIKTEVQGWYPVLNDSIALFKSPEIYPYDEYVFWSNVPESEY